MTETSSVTEQSLEAQVDVEALRAEVDKWQERVPKLAAALRERTDELATARDQIRALQQNPQQQEDVDARLKTRDELIRELEEKLAELNASFQQASGELHSARLGRTAAVEESEKWRRKWQELSLTLDKEAARSSDLDKERTQLLAKYETEQNAQQQNFDEQLARREEENQNLVRRNEQLLESMELANKQIANLGDDLGQLIAKVENSKQDLAASQQDLAATQEELTSTQASLSKTEAEVDNKTAELTALQDKLGALEQQLVEARQAASEREDALQIELEDLQENLDGVTQEQLQDQAEWSAKLADESARVEALQSELEKQQVEHQKALEHASAQDEEIARLEQCVQDASASMPRVEQEKAYLTQQIAERDDEIRKLNSNLAERSALVVELEAEKSARKNSVDEKDAEFEQLKIEVEAALNRATTFQQHNETLETRIQEQRGLIEDLERDLSHEQGNAGAARRQLEADERKRREAAEKSERLHQEALAFEQNKAQQALARVTDLETRLAAQEEQISQHQEELALALDAANAAEAALHAAEAVSKDQPDLAALQAQIAEKDAALKHTRAELIATRAESVDGATVVQLNEQLREVEVELRDRVQELNDLRWRESQQNNESEAMQSESVVMVLNQQLTDARNEIERLKAAYKTAQQASDDLTELHGVGDKLAEQLRDLGFGSFQQIAALQESDLEVESHKLHHLKSRIIRDDWINQAKSLT